MNSLAMPNNTIKIILLSELINRKIENCVGIMIFTIEEDGAIVSILDDRNLRSKLNCLPKEKGVVWYKIGDKK